jgi:cytochrome c oxidase cbb3-type subunit 3
MQNSAGGAERGKMRFQTAMAVAALAVGAITAQQAPPAAPAGGGRGGRGGGGGGFVPGQQRRPEDPAQVERGKAVYGINCTGCHGADLRGGDMGGPNLLRSQVAIIDKEGEMIIPVIQGSRQSAGMPAIQMSPEDAKATAAYIRSVMATIGRQGMPPAVGKEAPSILVGDAKAGQSAFDSKCAKCHSATGDLKGIASRISDPKMLQNTWVSGGGGGRRGRGAAAAGSPDARAVTAAITLPSGETVEGRLVRIDDFLVSVRLPDDTLRTYTRNGDVPKVEVRDPMKGHRDLLGTYTDKEMHDLTAYLVTLK